MSDSPRERPLTLIGDGIDNPGNVAALREAADLTRAVFRLHDVDRIRRLHPDAIRPDERLTPTTALSAMDPLIALDNLPGAASIWDFKLPAGPAPAVAAGNERRGLGAAVRRLATHRVEIPLAGTGLNTLNVAAAAATALWYLRLGSPLSQRVSSAPASRHPSLLLLAPGDHVELGSSLRSAAAFGWDRLFLDDRHHVWHDAPRALRAEGRAAARAHRNHLRLLSMPPDQSFAYDEAVIITAHGPGRPLHHLNLARGPSLLLAIPDEAALDSSREPWSRLARRITWATLGLERQAHPARYRLTATIALAEAARQAGRRARASGRPAPPYRHAVHLDDGPPGVLVPFDLLRDF